jgi:pimeloyl-ACP methyl ester carboxylesterase
MLLTTLLLCILPVQNETTPLPEGLLEFEILRPVHLGPQDASPVLLALPPGDQTRQMVEAGFGLYWREEAKRLGWTVISPLVPAGEFLGGENLGRLHELIDHVEKAYVVEGGKLHLAGVSNGGRSAFELALDRPGRFASLSVLPGLPNKDGYTKLEALRGLPLAMYVGGADEGWREGMTRVDEALRELDAPPVRFTIYEGEGHTPESLDGTTLFRTLEAFRVGSVLSDFHDAASKADGDRYFAHFAPGAIYMGTDASERWSVSQFQAYAEPHFSKGNGWTYVAKQRHTYLSPDGQTAWFDELLDNDSYGVSRGTGVFIRTEGTWRITQYHLTFPMPNSLAKQFTELIRAGEK